MNKKQILKASAFLLLFTLIFIPVNRVLSRPFPNYNYQMITGFYEEPEDSLDAVYIGSSNCLRYWNPLFAWEEFGISVYNYACDDLPPEAFRYIIEEVRKTQPDTLFLVNLNARYSSQLDMTLCHYLLDNMPLSSTRLAMTRRLSDAAGLSFSERLEYYFPILRFHSRWSELKMKDFSVSSNGVKGSDTTYRYVNRVEDITAKYLVSDQIAAPADWMRECMEDLLAYCDENDVNILFVVIPRAEEEELYVQQQNGLEALIQEWGYPVLNLLNDPSALGLDLANDFYNIGHTNIHGSMKFTRYVGRYLVDNYGFTDKRSSDAYASWNKAWKKYSALICPYMLDIEFEGNARDYSLAAPENAAAALSGSTVSLTWAPSQGAEGYRIYRRLGEDSWEILAEVTESGWEDTWAGADKSPLYRIVPFRRDGSGALLFGNFFTPGISVTTG